MFNYPLSIDDTWPFWVLGIIVASAGIWFLLGRFIAPLILARAAAVFVAIAGSALYAWWVHEEIFVSTLHPSVRAESIVSLTIYILLPAVAPLYLLRSAGGATSRRLAAALGLVASFGAFILAVVAFSLLGWASKVGDWGNAMMITLGPLSFLAVTGVAMARSAWRAAQQ